MLRVHTAALKKSAEITGGLYLLLVMGVALVFHYGRSASQPALGSRFQAFSVRDKPIEITAFPVEGVATPMELDVILQSMKPTFGPDRLGGKVPTSVLLHAVRLWGDTQGFISRSGADAREEVRIPNIVEYLLDNQEFRSRQTADANDLLVISRYGVRVMTFDPADPRSENGSTHFGKLAQVLAEAGVPATRGVTPNDGSTASVREIVQDDAARVKFDVELEFLACGLSRYTADESPWTNFRPQNVSFDTLAKELLDRPDGAGPCSGIHSPHALVTLLRVDESVDILPETTKQAIEQRLRKVSALLEEVQEEDGHWPWRWAQRADRGVTQPIMDDDDLIANVRITGHHLEWMAYAPPSCRPSDESIRRAARYLTTCWPRVTDSIDRDWRSYNPATHAARALLLLSGARMPRIAR